MRTPTASILSNWRSNFQALDTKSWSSRLNRLGYCGRDGLVVRNHAASHANCADDFSFPSYRLATAENDERSVAVRRLHAVKRRSGLHILHDVAGLHVERAGGERLALRDFDAGEQGAVHALEGQQVAPGIDDRDARRRVQLICLGQTGGDALL